MRFSLSRHCVSLGLLIAVAILPPSANAQGILRDLFRDFNGGPATEPTKMNVPGKTVRIKVGQVVTARWLGKPQWAVRGQIKFGPLRLTKDGVSNEWNVSKFRCLDDDDVKGPFETRNNYDKGDYGIYDFNVAPIILEFDLPADQRLSGQNITADLAMQVDYAGRDNRPFEAPFVSPKTAAMETPVTIKVASAEEAKQYNSIADSGALHQLTFYGGLAGCVVFLLIVGNFLWGRR